jgi:hypothetical protein
MKKRGKWPAQNFQEGRSLNGKKKKKTHQEMLNIPGHKANANLNHNKISVLLLLKQLLSIT